MKTDEGLPIQRSEVERAIKQIEVGKAIGEDGVAVEMIEALGEWGCEVVAQLANKIYDTGQTRTQMQLSSLIIITKKPGTMECNKHRTISIMSQLSKIILRVILNRIRSRIMPEKSEEQYGSRKDKGTTKAILLLRMISERAIEIQRDVFLCFIEYQKAVDTVKHEEMLNTLVRLGVDHRNIKLIKDLYTSKRQQ